MLIKKIKKRKEKRRRRKRRRDICCEMRDSGLFIKTFH